MFKTLSVIVDLMREQNSLLRELIQVLTHRPALTRKTGDPATTSRQFSEKDVFVQTRAGLAEQQQTSRQMASAPWRSQPSDPASEPKPSETTTNSK